MMKVIEFEDLDRTKIQMSMSSLATDDAIRLYLKDQEDKDTGHLHLSTNQAKMMIASLTEFIKAYDDE